MLGWDLETCMFGRGHTSSHAVVPVQMIGITGFVSHSVSCYLLLYHLLNGQMCNEICLWREDGKIKILNYNFYLVGPEQILRALGF